MAADFPTDQAVIEVLADVEHGRWSHWQLYLHEQCVRRDDGSLVIPADLVERWERLANTHYSDLTEDERMSDREHAAVYLHAINKLRKTN